MTSCGFLSLGRAPARRRLACLPLALASAFGGMALLQLPAVAHAQQDAPALGETVVTANRTPQSLSDLVGDVSVVDRQTIERSGAVGVADVLARLPGIEITRNGSVGNTTSLYIRGAETRFTAVYVDGVRVDSQSTGGAGWESIPLSQIDRIEVLRGPAGLLQGGSEPGGTVNLVRKRAPGKLMINADAAVGSFGLRRGTVDVGGALNAAGSVRARAVAVAEDRDSHVATLFNNKRLGYGTLEWDIAPSTTLSFGGAQQRVRSSIDQGLPTYADGRLASLPRSSFSGLASNRQDLETTDLFAELEHRLAGGGTVRLSARDVDRTAFYSAARANSALSPNGNFTMEIVDGLTHVKTRNYDLFASLPVDVAGRTHRLLVGASRSENKSYDNNFVYGTPVQANLLTPNYGAPYPALVLPGYSAITTRTENALYGQAQISVADSVKLLAGGRLSWADAVTRSTSTGAATSVADPGRQFVPSVAVLYDFHPQYTAYAGYSETFVVQSQLDINKQLLDPRTGKQVEVGLKGEFLDKRLQAHAAIFRIIDEDRAIADSRLAGAFFAGGKVRSQGFEAEVSGQVQPGWDVLAGYAYNDTLYLRAPVAQQGQVFSPVTPRHSVNVFTRYAFTSPALRGFSIGGGLSYRSDFFAQSGTLRITSGDYVLASAQVGYQINDQLALNLSVDNLFDKTYYEKVSGTSRQNFYGEPRRVTLALKARY